MKDVERVGSVGIVHPTPQEAPPAPHLYGAGLIKAGRDGIEVSKGNDFEATAVKLWSGVHHSGWHTPDWRGLFYLSLIFSFMCAALLFVSLLLLGASRAYA